MFALAIDGLEFWKRVVDEELGERESSRDDRYRGGN